METLALALVWLCLFVLGRAGSHAEGTDCPTVITSQDNLSATSNDQVSFHCDVMSTTLPADIHWLHVGTGRTMGSINQTVTLGSSQWRRLTVVVKVTSDLDMGPYVCRVHGHCGWSKSDHRYILLKGKPRVRLSLPLMVSREPAADMQYLVITCVVDSYPSASAAHVRWRTGNALEGQPVYLEPSLSGRDYNSTISGDNATYTLTLTLSNTYEGGLFFCEASNSIGTSVSQSVLVVFINESPKLFFNTTEVPLAVGEAVYLPCPPSPEGSETVWTRDGKTIVTGSKAGHADLSDTGLVIRYMSLDLSGVYACTRHWAHASARSAVVRLTLTSGFPKPTIYPLSWKHAVTSATSTDGTTTTTTATRTDTSTLRLQCLLTASRPLPAAAVRFRFVLKSRRIRLSAQTVTSMTQRQQGQFYEYGATAELGPVAWEPPEELNDVTAGNVELGKEDEVLCQIFLGNTKMSEESWPIIYDGLAELSTLKGPSKVDLSRPVHLLVWSCQSQGVPHSRPVINLRLDTETRLSVQHTADPSLAVQPQTETRRWSRVRAAVLVDAQRSLTLKAGNDSRVLYVFCHVHYRHVIQNLTLTVHIDYPPVFAKSLQAVSVRRGLPVTLDCGIRHAANLAYFYWARINGSLDLTSGNFGEASRESPELTIYQSAATNAGFYYCVAGNAIGEVASPLIQLFVFDEGDEGFVMAFLGDTITLRCTDPDDSLSKVTWSRGQDQRWAPASPRYRQHGVYLTIHGVRAGDAGFYTCIRQDDSETPLKAVFTVEVSPDALRPPTLLPHGSFREGSQSALTCSIELSALMSVSRFPVRWLVRQSEAGPEGGSVRDSSYEENEHVIYRSTLTFADLSADRSDTLLVCMATLDQASSAAEYRLMIREASGRIAGEDQTASCAGSVTQAYPGLENYNVVFTTVVVIAAMGLAGLLIYSHHRRDRRRQQFQYERLRVLAVATNNVANRQDEERRRCDGDEGRGSLRNTGPRAAGTRTLRDPGNSPDHDLRGRLVVTSETGDVDTRPHQER